MDRGSARQAVEEHREGRDLGVRLMADRDVPIDQVEHFAGHLFGADDD